MRALAEPSTLWRAGLAAALSSLACLPRLNHWQDRPEATWFLLAMLGWSAFVLWAFVFAWYERYSGRRLFPTSLAWSSGAIATALGLAGALTLFSFIDPVIRKLAPREYPRDVTQWLAHVFFHLSLEQLLLCFAPVAVCLRLTRSFRCAAAILLTFNFAVLLLKLEGVADLSGTLILGLIVFRALSVLALLWAFWRGGIWLAWWLGLCGQARHLWSIPGGSG